MPVFRINKTKNYTIMSNSHLKNKKLSLKAKGLLSVMLSLPDEWDYSINGLVAISKESETSIKSALKELKETKYLKIQKEKDKQGKFRYIYDIYEKPEGDFPPMDNPQVELPAVENVGQLNTKKLKTNNKKKNTKKKNENNITNFEQREYNEKELKNLYVNMN